MPLTHFEIRKRFRTFYEKNGHKEVPPIPLVPQNDPTTLFTGSGMQQFVPNLLGEPHPQGKELYNIQRCFRAQDIEEVGDNRHTTFFEMIGNWSLGTYFKKEQLSRLFSFLIDAKEGLGLNPKQLFVTVFIGDDQIPRDTESIEVWKELFDKAGIKAEIDKRIFMYDATKNWWSRAGVPENMPPGEPGGPDSEVFFDFGPQLKLHENSPFREKPCHPNCDCGRYMEIANSVFMQYQKQQDGTFKELPQKNVDFGGGMERFAAVINKNPDVFTTDLFNKIIAVIQKENDLSYDNQLKKPMRVIADHLKAAVFMASEGLKPGNKEQGYFMRRLIRRSVVKMHELNIVPTKITPKICKEVINTYGGVYFKDINPIDIELTITDEVNSFLKTLDKGIKLLQTQTTIDGRLLFNLKQSYGFPLEIAFELLEKWERKIDRKKLNNEFQEQYIKHQKISRASAVVKFKGGLADHSAQTLKYHTATHLLHQALIDVLGSDVRQEGSNITSERLRFDFYSMKKPSQDEIKKTERIINEKITSSLPVSFKIIPREEAYKIGAKSFFREKYPDMVKVYFVGDYSKEFCGGPHVENTKEIGEIEIFKFEKIGSNLYRVYAK